MVRKEQIIFYSEFSSLTELFDEDRELIEKAEEAVGGSYAPYSHFNVGAAVRLKSGRIVLGANQENAAYPSGLCAERTAIFSANANFPNDSIVAIAILAKQKGQIVAMPAAPCGACRQVMIESQKRGGNDIKVILGSKNKYLIFNSISDILPFAFDNI
jgi:cytidine deaminase